VHRERAGVGQELAHPALELAEVGELLGRGLGVGVLRIAGAGQAQLDLAALEAAGEELAQGRLERAVFVRRRSARSRKRPLTERNSTPIRAPRKARSAHRRAVRAMLPQQARQGSPRHWRSRSCCKLPRSFAPSFAIMSKPKPAPLPSGTVVGGYQVIKKLAAGGFGVVYLCEDADRKLVALKEYLPSSLAERSPGELTPRVKPEKQPLYRLGLKSFFEEGRSLAQISHTSVVSVLNFFRENETVYMVMNYLQGDTLQDFIVTARDLKRDKVFRESTIRSLFDEILRGLRIVHQHKMLHLDIKPANIFITNENKAVLLDFGAAREVLSKEGNFIRPMYTPGFAAPEMYRRDGTLGPWTDIYAIGACIYACMQGYPPNDAPQRIEKDRLALSLSRLRNVYSDNLIEVTEWCMSLDPLSRPQSVFALQKELSRETERQYTKLSFSERLKLQLENITSSAKA
jgi:serine/threonine protein kinase